MTHFEQLHVHKTGGSSLIVYAKKHNLDWNGGSHAPFITRRIPKNSILITNLRCPIKRIVSMFCGGLGPAYNFSDWLRDPFHPQGPKEGPDKFWKDNSYVRFFGNNADDFNGAIENIKKVNHILDTSHLSRDFNEKVVSKHKIPKFDVHENKSRRDSRPTPTEGDINFLKKHLANDFEICKMFGIEISV